MFKAILKKILITFGFDITDITQGLSRWSIKLALTENGFCRLAEKLYRIESDLFKQYSSQREFNDYWELKIRAQHAFQCTLMLKALKNIPSGKLTVVDIGDSAGTHMLYLKELTKNKFNIDTISVNLDPRAIEKIKARGLKAILCRAEDLELEEGEVDLFVSFEMVEHLHNPAIFLRRLAKKSQCNRLVVTVPYMKKSRVGLHHLRDGLEKTVCAEEEHIFELSPRDWTLLMLHSGWKVIYNKIYYQYPRKCPVISYLLALYWRETDFEGFWGAILEKDIKFSDRYQDWPD